MYDFELASSLLRSSLARVYGEENWVNEANPVQSAISQLAFISVKDLSEREWIQVEWHLVKALKKVGSEFTAARAEEIADKAKNVIKMIWQYKSQLPPERLQATCKTLSAIHDAAQLKIADACFDEFKKNPSNFLLFSPVFHGNVSQNNEAIRLRIAYYLAENNPELLINHFEKFPLKNEKDRIDLAKLVAKSNDYDLLYDDMHLFNISKESALEKIFLIVGKKDPAALVNLSAFRIISEKRLVHIFTVLANTYPGQVAATIRHHMIWNAYDKADIAKRVAEKDGQIVLKNIKNFKITDQQALAGVVRKAIIQNPQMIKQLPTLGITDVHENICLVLAAVSLDKTVVSLLPRMNQQGIDEVIDSIRDLEQKENLDNVRLAKQKLIEVCAKDDIQNILLKKVIEK